MSAEQATSVPAGYPTLDMKTIKLGDSIKAGSLMGGLSSEPIMLRLVEDTPATNASSKRRTLTFKATYYGINLGEVRYTSGRWSKTWA